MRRAPITVAMALVWLILLATPADAHGSGGAEASNFLTRLQSVSPQVPGLDVEIIENGSRIQVTNSTDQEVVVLGYQDEPYLRIGPDGVAENLRSPATYQNRDRQATTAVPDSADPEAGPEWSRISEGNVARWHDHRAHWMSSEEPPVVQEDPGRRHTVIPEWTVTMQVGEEVVEVTGDLIWVPGPSVVPWLALAGALLAATVVAALSPAGRWVLTAALTVAVVADVVHAIGIGFAATGGLGTQIGQVFAGSFVSLTGWGLGVLGVVLLARDREGALPVAAVAGALIALNGGIVELGEVGRSQILFVWSDTIFRATTAAALGLGLGLVVTGGLRYIQLRRDLATVTEPA